MQQTNEQDWQNRLLPFMVRMLIGMAIFFFVGTAVQLFFLHQEVRAERDIKTEVVAALFPDNIKYGDALATSRLKAEIVMEEAMLRRNFHQANILLLSRTWIRYLGFVTGMILAFVGATFVLGKLQTSNENEIAAQLPSAHIALKSHSPGLILSAMGCVLMVATILVNHTIKSEHRAIYLKEGVVPIAHEEEAIVPELPPLPNDLGAPNLQALPNAETENHQDLNETK